MVKFVSGVLLLLSIGGAHAGIRIEIDKSTQLMSVSVDGVIRHTWPVSTGRAAYATPSGSFRPFRLEVDHYSKEWDDAPMPHSIFFTRDGHAIHGSYETRRLGSAASHGCVRLAPRNAATLFGLVQRHGLASTTITVGGTQPKARRPAPPRYREDTPVARQLPDPVLREPSYEMRPDQWQQPTGFDPYYGREYGRGW
jgi:hypothetical protein